MYREHRFTVWIKPKQALMLPPKIQEGKKGQEMITLSNMKIEDYIFFGIY